MNDERLTKFHFFYIYGYKTEVKIFHNSLVFCCYSKNIYLGNVETFCH